MAVKSRVVIFETTTKLENYEVVEEIYTGRYSRLLYSGRIKTAQSGIPLDNVDQMLFEYTQRLVELVQQTKASDILMIGGGTFTLPTYLLKKLKNISFDVVEPDKALEQIARQYFGLVTSSRLNIICDYGLHFLKTSKKKYDLIILDAYLEESIPSELLTKKFAKLASSSLKTNGIIAANVISTLRDDSVVHQMHSVYKKHFKHINIYPAARDRSYYYDHNLIYVASKQPSDLKLKFPSLGQLELSG